MDMSSFADSLKRKEKKRDEAYAYVTLFVQEKGEEDRGEESAAGQEDRGRGVRCKEWQQMHNPLVESIERASCVCVVRSESWSPTKASELLYVSVCVSGAIRSWK